MERITATEVTDGPRGLERAIEEHYAKQSEQVQPDREIIEVGMGVAFQFPKLFIISDKEIPEVYSRLAIDYDSKLRVAVPVSVQVVRLGPGVQITSNTLRQLPIRAYIREGLKSSALLNENGEYVPWDMDTNWSEADEGTSDAMHSRGPSAQMLETVIRVYRIAEVANDSPAKAVQETFDLTPATTTRWIRKAKERYPQWRETHTK